ncbi:type 1 glutamine amidotransferase family protein [Methanobrevibacter arboriphilus]|uniref:hypothetical protein n=1 Tax=Methanobrevibacter arboriphilus TaxID=39441 RepID=UPI00373FDB4B
MSEDKPFLGVCLGLQALLSSSEETPGVKGLDIFKGKVKKLPIENGLKIPHMGWNRLDMTLCESKKKLFYYRWDRPRLFLFRPFILCISRR